jgi:DNA-binding response OmpR family regulator
MTTRAKQLLVVEDDRLLRRACAASLRQRGWTVLTAAGAEEDLAMTRTETVDLILREMLMPKLHGLEVVQLWAVDDLGKAHLSTQALDHRVA